MEKEFISIPLEAIDFGPNARTKFDERALEELATSIKEVGILEPIIVRAAVGGQFRLIAGARRCKAALKAGLNEVPARILAPKDEEAEFTISAIENLQREDLTEYEEAVAFSRFVGDVKVRVDELSERTGIRPAYIRARIDALSLPAKIVKAWQKGEITFAHIQQLGRIKKDKPTMMEFFDSIIENEWSAARLKAHISQKSFSIGSALFDTTKCGNCLKNSDVQKTLFEVEALKFECVDSKCFREKQRSWLREHWKETTIAKKAKTNTFAFKDELNYGQYHEFESRAAIPKKCVECDYLTSLIEVEGKIAQWPGGPVCVGDKSCFKAVERAATAAEQAKARGEKKSQVDAGTVARVSWHGEYFRQAFFRRRIREILADKPIDTMLPVLALCVMANDNRAVAEHIEKVFKLGSGYVPAEKRVARILPLVHPELDKIFVPAVIEALTEGINRSGFDNGKFPTTCRRLVAEALGVELAKEWVMDAEYLAKKTTKEILAIIAKFKLMKDEKFQKAFDKTGRKKIEKCKKSELADLILKSGVDLAGLVPAEITAKSER